MASQDGRSTRQGDGPVVAAAAAQEDTGPQAEVFTSEVPNTPRLVPMVDLNPFWPPDPIRTERLVLREAQAADREPIIALLSSPEVGQFVGGARDRAELERTMGAVPGERAGFFVVELDGATVGFVTLDPHRAESPGHVCPEQGELDLGYMFVAEVWGHGLATEAGAAVLRWLDDAVPGQRVVLTARADNHASLAVARKLGFSPLETFEAWGAQQWLGVRDPQ